MRITLHQTHVMLDLDDGAYTGCLRRHNQNLHNRMLVAGRNAAGWLIQQNDDVDFERKGTGDIE